MFSNIMQHWYSIYESTPFILYFLLCFWAMTFFVVVLYHVLIIISVFFVSLLSFCSEFLFLIVNLFKKKNLLTRLLVEMDKCIDKIISIIEKIIVLEDLEFSEYGRNYTKNIAKEFKD